MHEGELLAVLGANGSGKSTTCHVLCGITPPTSGDALVDDKFSLLERGNGDSLVGWCPQHDILFDELTPLEHVLPFPGFFSPLASSPLTYFRFPCMLQFEVCRRMRQDLLEKID